MRRTAIVLVLMVMAAALPVVRVVAKDAPAGSAAGPNVWADFDNDGFVDLAVGTPSEDVGTIVDAGAVTVLYGSAAGLTGAGSQQFTQDTPGIVGAAETDDGFGEALAAGDFNNNGVDDLAVGAPSEDVGAAVNGGSVNVLYGSRRACRPPAASSSPRTPRGCPAAPRPRTPSARRWPPATSTATASTTWGSASPPRTSAPC